MEHDQDRQFRKALFTDLYTNAFPSFARFAGRMGGNLDEAKDVFQDALLVWYEKNAGGNLKVQRSDKAYVLGTAKYLWIRRFKDLAQQQPLRSGLDLENFSEQEEKPSDEKILAFLEIAGQKCMNLLKAFYYDKLSPAKLSRKFGFSGERSATVQKYKCLEKVRAEVKQRSLSYADFIE